MLRAVWNVVVPFLPSIWQELLSTSDGYAYVLSMPGERYFVRDLAQIEQARLPALIELAEQEFFGLIELEGNFNILVVKRILTTAMEPELLCRANAILENQGALHYENVVYYVLDGFCSRPRFRVHRNNLFVDDDCVTWNPNSCYLVDDKGNRVTLVPPTKQTAVTYLAQGLLRAANMA